MILSRHDQVKVRKHVKVKPGASVYDSSLALYFAKRMPLSHPRSKNLKGIFVKQKYSIGGSLSNEAGGESEA